MARALAFEGSVLAYNPMCNEAEWVPAWGLANDLTPGKERSVIALTNYVPQVTSEAVWIVRVGASQVVNWSGTLSTTEEEEMEGQTTDTDGAVGGQMAPQSRKGGGAPLGLGHGHRGD